MQIVDILKAAQQQNSSDIHIAPGNPVMLRIDGMLVPQGNQVLTNVDQYIICLSRKTNPLLRKT